MRDPNFKQDLPNFFRKVGIGLVGIGVAGCLLPLFGLQLARLRDIDLGVWTGVPFIALGAISLGLSLLARDNAKLVKRIALGVAIGFIMLIGGGFVLGMVLHNVGVGTPDIDEQIARDAEAQVEARETRPLDRPSARERTSPLPASSSLPDEHWTIPVAQDLSTRAVNRLGRMLNGRAAELDGIRHVSALKGMEGVRIRVYPRVEAALVEDLMAGFGDLALDEADDAGAFTLDTDSADSAWRGQRSWNVRVSGDDLSLSARSRIRRTVRDAMPDRLDECDFVELDGAWVLIASPIDDGAALRRALSALGDTSIDTSSRNVELTLRTTP